MEERLFTIEHFEKSGRLSHCYPLSEEQKKLIEETLYTVYFSYAVDELDFYINFCNAKISIESEPSGWYMKLYHRTIPRINKIEAVRLGDCEEYQIDDIPNDDKLTEQEAQFAAENHDLVFNFLGWQNLSKDIYYDVVVMGYLKAVKDYNRKESARKYRFFTIANRGMFDSLYKYWRSEGADKRKIYYETLSLDAEITTDGKPCALADFVPDTRNDFESDESINEIMEKCTEVQRRIISMLIDGVPKRKIQKACGIGRKAYETEMESIKGIVEIVLA